MDKPEKIRDLFHSHKKDLGRVIELAQQVRAMIGIIDPFIQQHTSVVCPACRKVCCISRHSHYECDDLIYLHALCLEPHVCEQRSDDEPCWFLSATGCSLDRSVRPSGCNWYLCDALYDSMEKAPEKEYTDFDNALHELANLWMELGAEFRRKFKTISGAEL